MKNIYKPTIPWKIMKTEYGIIKKQFEEFHVRELLVVPHGNSSLTVSFPSFGPNTYTANLEEMSKNYSHPITGKRISFREPTTSESISAAAYDFENMAKPKIFDPKWLQAGYIVRTQDGVFTNTKELDEKVLKSSLNKAKKANGIYLINDKMAFAPYETFKQGFQDCDTFAESGLARALEHTQKKTAKNLKEIASPKFYKKGVNVWRFYSLKEPALRVVSLFSDSNIYGGEFVVGGDHLDGYSGYAFGVLRKPAKLVRKK